jgi:hypothetical protein
LLHHLAGGLNVLGRLVVDDVKDLHQATTVVVLILERFPVPAPLHDLVGRVPFVGKSNRNFDRPAGEDDLPQMTSLVIGNRGLDAVAVGFEDRASGGIVLVTDDRLAVAPDGQ